MNRATKWMKQYFNFLVCFFLIFAATITPLHADSEDPTNTTETVKVAWYEDSYHITNKNGNESGYGYEFEQALDAYTGWNLKYVRGDWTDLLEKLQNGQIDIMSSLSYTEERAQTMLFSDQPMGEERYYLYADLSNTDISPSDLSTLNGKPIGVMEKSVQATQFYQWEEKNNIQTTHVFVDSMDKAKEMIQNHEMVGVISTETPIWVEYGMSSIAMTGKSDIYFGINKNRPDLKEKIDNAMRSMDNDKPFYADDLYKKYIATQSVSTLSSLEKEWLKNHGSIRIGYLINDSGFSTINQINDDPIGVINDYVNDARDNFNKKLKFKLIGYSSLKEEIKALKNSEIDMIFHLGQNPYYAQKNEISLSNTVLSSPQAIVTTQDAFDESANNTVGIVKDNPNYKWYISYNYPKWKIKMYDSIEKARLALQNKKVDCIAVSSFQAMESTDNTNLHSVFLTVSNDACFGVKKGNTTLLSILNKTLKSIQTSKLSGAVSSYQDALKKVTVKDFIKDNLVVVLVSFVSLLLVILFTFFRLLKKARKAEENAKRANAAKSTFLFNMSHDIRTPMNAILGFAELAKKDTNSRHQIMEYLEKIKISGKGLLSILDNILELSRIESGKTTLEEMPQEAGKIFDSCMIMMNPEIEKRHHTLIASKNIKYPYVYYDGTRMTEIIINILSNAIKYTSDGGMIRCTLNQLPHPDEKWINQELIIEDTGIGMSEEFQNHIFESFSRERTSTASGIQGTGLGMGIVKKIVDLMNGTIDIQSKPGKGTRVTIVIPMKLATQEDTLPKHLENVQRTNKLKDTRILLAEDNQLNAEIAIELLKEEGAIVEHVKDGVQCLDKIKENPAGYYSLILMDVQMPNLDGYETTKRIRKMSDTQKKNIPIIAMTANAFSEDKAQALEAGMNGHIAKPIDMNVLVDVISKYI